MEIAYHFESVARGETLTESQLRKTILELAEIATGKKLKSITISRYFTDWITRLERQKTLTTFQRYRMAIRSLLKFLGEDRCAAPLDTLQTEQIQGFVDQELDSGKTPKTVNTTLKTISIPLNIARRQGLIPHNPVTAIEMPQVVS